MFILFVRRNGLWISTQSSWRTALPKSSTSLLSYYQLALSVTDLLLDDGLFFPCLCPLIFDWLKNTVQDSGDWSDTTVYPQKVRLFFFHAISRGVEPTQWAAELRLRFVGAAGSLRCITHLKFLRVWAAAAFRFMCSPGSQRASSVPLLHPQLAWSPHVSHRGRLSLSLSPHSCSSPISKTAIAYYSGWSSWWQWGGVLCPLGLLSGPGRPSGCWCLSVLVPPPTMSAQLCPVRGRTCLGRERGSRPVPVVSDPCFVLPRGSEPRVASLSLLHGKQILLLFLLPKQRLSAWAQGQEDRNVSDSPQGFKGFASCEEPRGAAGFHDCMPRRRASLPSVSLRAPTSWEGALEWGLFLALIYSQMSFQSL